jgi:hypothetical protein
MVLALIAVLAVAGPGFVLAGAPTASYPKPLYADIIGPSVVAPGGSASYSLVVTYSDGTSSPATSGVTWSARNGTFSGNTYTNTTGSKDLLSATFSNGVGSGKANRLITIGP